MQRYAPPPANLTHVKLIGRILFLLFVAGLAYVLLLVGNYVTIPSHNTSATHFDTIIVLGCPAKADGTPSPEQRERVLEGVREYKAGVAPHIIMTGGPAHNQFVEAHVMAQFALTQGVPASAIVEEPQAQNTIQNIYYSARIMHQNGWNSAEIVSSPSHLPRTALIVNTFNADQPNLYFNWRTHAAHWPPEYSFARILGIYTGEAQGCLRLRFNGFPSSRFLPRNPQMN
ncbi:MAG TPA: YdcF family protein [Edaphobacter sp.]|nr:YdcF family protein [Edaphobacter sp.]